MDHQEAERVLALAIASRRELDVGGPRRATDELVARPSLIPDAAACFQAAGNSKQLLELLGLLSIFWQDTGEIEKGRRLTEQHLEGAGYGPTSELARAQLVVGELAFRQGDQEGAMVATNKARETGGEVADQWAVARAELNFSRIAFRDGDAERIKTHAERVSELAGDDRALACGATHMLGWSEYTSGNIDSALELFEENALSYREQGKGVNEAGEWANLADLAAEKGDIDRACAYLNHALEIPAAVQSSYLLPSLINSAGVLAALRGQPRLSLELVGAADGMYERSGLIGDPGEEFAESALAKAGEQVGKELAKDLRVQGRALSAEQAVALARGFLAPTR